MKNFLKNVGLFLWNILRRIAFLVATIIMWPVWIVTTVIYVPLEVAFLLFVAPILWVILGCGEQGGELFVKIGKFLFFRKNKEIWHTDYTTTYEADGTFFSLMPCWAEYVQKEYLVKILPEDERD